ncbi:MAG: hypothetical protein JWM85_1059 [Acidimicrobiaceae bacterium]|nr:hypothetical protein [Acidimicrobiaceae bacterium]
MVALLICDVSIGRIRNWWNVHSLTGNIVSSLLLIAVTGLVLDEVVARRQRREREVSVAAQALIVYGQARRTCEAIVGTERDASDLRAAKDEARDLASMVLTASSSLFDDPEGREFLSRVQRLIGALYLASSASPSDSVRAELDKVKTEMERVTFSAQPLMARIPADLLPNLDALSDTGDART